MARSAPGFNVPADCQLNSMRNAEQSTVQPDIAVLVPCYNEGTAIGSVVRAFREQLPEARIYVYDNNSSDGTAAAAAEAGAIVRKELQQGKGHVVRRMFSDIDAAIYDGRQEWGSGPASEGTGERARGI